MTGYFAVPLVVGGVTCVFCLMMARNVRRASRGSAAMQETSLQIQQQARQFLRRALLRGVPLIALIAALLAGASLLPASILELHSINPNTALAFLMGVLCTAVSAEIGLLIATGANARTTEGARLDGARGALRIALGAAGVAGLLGGGLMLLGLCALHMAFGGRAEWLAGFGLGTGLMAMLLRLGSGVYSKGADLGGDIGGKLEADLAEDDPRNAAAIADNAGDNLTGVTAAGSDLMDSQLAAIVATLSIGATLDFVSNTWRGPTLLLPLAVVALGGVTSILSLVYMRALAKTDPHKSLTRGILLAALLMLPAAYPLCIKMSGRHTQLGTNIEHNGFDLFLAVTIGVLCAVACAGIAHFQGHSQRRAVHTVADQAPSGAAFTLLTGLAAGMRASLLPGLVLAAGIGGAFGVAGAFGVGLAACSMLATGGMLSVIQAYRPIADNAGGIAQMARVERFVREITDNLNDAGAMHTATCRTLACAGGGMAAVALVLAFCYAARVRMNDVALSQPAVIGALLLGGVLPFCLAAAVLRALGRTALGVLQETRRQLYEIPGIMENKARPDYAHCGELATQGGLRAMLVPTAAAVLVPLAVGLLLGRNALAGMLVGAVITGLPLGLMMANAGTVLEGSKRRIEGGNFGGQGSLAHSASLVGDAVGDAFKDAVGPAVGMLIKLMAITALVLAPLLREARPWLELLLR